MKNRLPACADRAPWPPRVPDAARRTTTVVLATALALVGGGARGAEATPSDALSSDLAVVQRWASDLATQTSAMAGARVEVELGRLDPRLRLAPCARVEPSLPSGARFWGRTRIALRCVDGPTHWNVYLPLTVHVYALAPALRDPLPAGTTLTDEHLVDAEIDWADRADAPVVDRAALVGHELARSLPAGSPLRDADLRRREWFAAGDRVRVTGIGSGFRVRTEGQALGRGIDGRSVRVRTDSGRIVTGTAIAEREVEVRL